MANDLIIEGMELTLFRSNSSFLTPCSKCTVDRESGNLTCQCNTSGAGTQMKNISLSKSSILSILSWLQATLLTNLCSGSYPKL